MEPQHHNTLTDSGPQYGSKGQRSNPRHVVTSLGLDAETGHTSDSAAMRSPSRSASNTPSKSITTQNKGSARRPKKTKQRTGAHSDTEAMVQLDGTSSTQPPVQQSTTSQHAMATPIKQAYAGPTFHASPAASSLPMPKFFSRSVPSVTPNSKLHDFLGAEESPRLPTHDRHTSATPRAGPIPRENSPLDVFFNAHRAEQARQRSGDSEFVVPKPSQSTPSLHGAPQTPTRHTPQQQRKHVPPQSGKEMFMMELDGIDDREDSDSVSPNIPFKDRLRAAKPDSRPKHLKLPSDDDLHRQAQSQALKRMLMTPPASSGNGNGSGSAPVLGSGPYPHSPFSRPKEAQIDRPEPVVSGSRNHNQPPQQGQQTDFRAMEENLRKMLRLE